MWDRLAMYLLTDTGRWVGWPYYHHRNILKVISGDITITLNKQRSLVTPFGKQDWSFSVTYNNNRIRLHALCILLLSSIYWRNQASCLVFSQLDFANCILVMLFYMYVYMYVDRYLHILYIYISYIYSHIYYTYILALSCHLKCHLGSRGLIRLRFFFSFCKKTSLVVLCTSHYMPSGSTHCPVISSLVVSRLNKEFIYQCLVQHL